MRLSLGTRQSETLLLIPIEFLQTGPEPVAHCRLLPNVVILDGASSTPNRRDRLWRRSSALQSSTRVGGGRAWPLRVAIGFAAVGLTVIVANISTQQSAREAREKVRELLVQHEPLVRATESLAAAVSMYERAVIDQSETSTIAQQPVKAAAQRMTETADEYQQAASRFPELDRPAPAFAGELNNFLKSGDDLLRSSVARRSRMRDYWSRFDTLETSLNAPQANAVRFAGAVFASEKLMDLVAHAVGRARASQRRCEHVITAFSAAHHRE